MNLPMRTFWLMFGNVARIQADNDMRALIVASAGQSVDGFKAHLETLTTEKGQVFKISDKYIAQTEQVAAPEVGAFDKLRSLGG